MPTQSPQRMPALTMQMPLPIMEPATSISASSSWRERWKSDMRWRSEGRMMR